MRTKIMAFGVTVAFGLCAIPAMAQMQNSGTDRNVAVATTTSTPRVEILSAGAPPTDLNLSGYQAFDQFAQEHPEIVRQLHRNPRLVNDPSYARKHPAFAQFLRDNPKVAEDLAENPGNYLARSPA